MARLCTVRKNWENWENWRIWKEGEERGQERTGLIGRLQA